MGLKKQQLDEDCGTCEALNFVEDVVRKRQPGAAVGGGGGGGGGSGGGGSSDGGGAEQWVMEAPANYRQLGNGAWTLLHTMAAYYPEQPSGERQSDTRQFLFSLSKTYPCTWCATDMQQQLIDDPPQLETRTDFAKWLCGFHNHVNVKLGKPLFDCDRVDERWRRPMKKKE